MLFHSGGPQPRFHTAFAFHRTAFKDRIENVKAGLKTIDHLRDYHPKHRADRSSRAFGGTRTPIFSSLGFGAGAGATPSGDKQDYFSAPHVDLNSRAGTPELDYHGDAEDDGHGEGRKKTKGKQRRSWMWPSRQSSFGTPGSSAPMNAHTPPVPAVLNTTAHTYPPSRAHSPEGLAVPHRPGTPASVAGRHSQEEEAAIVHAAKALKTAVLHDARNLTGKVDNEGMNGMGWNVNSAHEAKVRCLFFCLLLWLIVGLPVI